MKFCIGIALLLGLGFFIWIMYVKHNNANNSNTAYLKSPEFQPKTTRYDDEKARLHSTIFEYSDEIEFRKGHGKNKTYIYNEGHHVATIEDRPGGKGQQIVDQRGVRLANIDKNFIGSGETITTVHGGKIGEINDAWGGAQISFKDD